ncbi:MAG TPA: GGDEF domain-containing protein [Candidatus Limnocylindria bacterium]|jgi:diguanylate cyclase (GGDEF)-like protein
MPHSTNTMHDRASEVAAALGVEDLMVFELSAGGARLMGGVGRGAGWAGIVDVNLAEEPVLRDVINLGHVVRLACDEPAHVIGPYWSANAAVARAGDHVLVVGSSTAIRASSAELTRRATEAVAAIGEVPPSKLLADELELVQAVRQLTDFRPRSLADTARHVAEVAADALSCEIGAVLMRHDGRTKVYGAGAAWAAMEADEGLMGELHELAVRAANGPIVEQDLGAVGASGLRVVSCYALGIGRSEQFGALVVGHTDARPRGFTLLCQRVGRALADASEPALLQAIALEELSAQRDRFAREARTDPLTGLGNRNAWHDTLTLEQARMDRHPRAAVLLSIDLDELKATNDAFGHAIGDELLVAAAGILRRSLRRGDVVVRLGGDEFAAFLPESDAAAAAAVRRRVDGACRHWRGSQPDARLSMSIGWAIPAEGETLAEAHRRADAAMYEVKRAAAAAAAS